jgi:hypothetical protein
MAILFELIINLNWVQRFRVQRFWVQGFRVQRFRVQGSGFSVQGCFTFVDLACRQLNN